MDDMDATRTVLSVLVVCAIDEPIADSLMTHLAPLERELEKRGGMVNRTGLEAGKGYIVPWTPGDIILFLITPRFLETGLVEIWLPALQAARASGCTIVPVLGRKCCVLIPELLRYQALPKGWPRDDPANTGWISDPANDAHLSRVARAVNNLCAKKS